MADSFVLSLTGLGVVQGAMPSLHPVKRLRRRYRFASGVVVEGWLDSTQSRHSNRRKQPLALRCAKRALVE